MVRTGQPPNHGANQMSSPTFVAMFADGTITRMTTYRPGGKLDLGRGVRLSRAAYESRKKQPPPALTSGHFETPPFGGCAAVVIRSYTADELKDAWMLPRMDEGKRGSS